MPSPVPMSDQAGRILNRVAAEVSIATVQDPFAVSDPTFSQLIQLMNTAGEELVLQFPWEQLQNEANITTQNGDTGDYALPTDFAYMTNQTGWERNSQVPLFGPLSPQEWQYLKARDPGSATLYASFRIKQGQFSLFPAPPSVGLNINYEYIGKNWVQDGDTPTLFKDSVERFSDVPLYNRLLIGRYVKVKYQEAHGLDSTKAQDDFNQIYAVQTGQNMGAPVLNAGGGGYTMPLLNGFNAPLTGYGS